MAKIEIKEKKLIVGNDITPTTYRLPCEIGEYPAGTVIEFNSATKKFKKATTAANMFGIISEDTNITATNDKAVVYVTGRFDLDECIYPTVDGEDILDYKIRGKEIGIFFAE